MPKTKAELLREYQAPYELFTGVTATDYSFTSRTHDEMIEINARQLAFWSLHFQPMEIDAPFHSSDEHLLRQMFVRNNHVKVFEYIRQRWPPELVREIRDCEDVLIATHVVGVDGNIKRV